MTEGIGFGKNSAGLHITQKTGISPEIRGFNVNTAGKDDTCLGDKISEMKNYGIFFDIFLYLIPYNFLLNLGLYVETKKNQLVGTLVLCGNTKIPLTVVSYCERDFTF